MIRALWIARTGLDAQQTQLDVISNNLANVATNGFKRSRAVFEDLLYQNLRQPGAQSTQQTTIPSGLQIGTGARPIATERIHTQGNLTQTGNALDVAIQGEGFFQILTPDGTTAYTRDGAFQKDANGQIVTSSGYPLQPAITIPANALSVTIGKDGVVSVTLPNQAAAAQIGNIQLASFVNPDAQRSTAIIQIAGDKPKRVGVGDEINSSTRLHAVHKDHVVLDRGGREESLHFPAIRQPSLMSSTYNPQEPTALQLEQLQDEDVQALQERIQTLQQRMEGEGDMPQPDAPEAE